MFTGIVEAVGEVVGWSRLSDGSRMRVRTRLDADGASLGDSIAVNGCCLTVVDRAAIDGGKTVDLSFDLSPETLSRTTFGALAEGRRLNLERALPLGGRLGGHVVLGHVDATVRVIGLVARGDFLDVDVELPAALARYVVEKGSVCLDGTSLTVAHVAPGRFGVSLIPATRAATISGGIGVGDRMNLEVDIVAKHVERLLAGYGGSTSTAD